MVINDGHPLLLDNLKTQTSPERYYDSSIRVMEGIGMSGAKPRPFSYEYAVKEYRSWIYAAINLNATAIASTDLRLFVRNAPNGLRRAFRSRPCKHGDPGIYRYLTGGIESHSGTIKPAPSTRRKIISFGDDFEEVTDSHPILDLIRMVNPWHNGFDLLQLLTIYIEATGNAYWHPVIDPILGVPSEIWPMPSQWVQVVPDVNQYIAGYVYGQTVREQQEFAANEVIHFRTANPSNDGLFYGMGKIEAGWWAVNQNRSTHEMDIAFAENQARPDYLAVVKGGSSQDILDRFEENVKRQLRGTQKSGRFLTLTGDVQMVPLNWSPKDMVGRDEIVEEVAAVFGVPVTLLKANDPNLASAQVGYAAWKSNTILPLLHLIEQKLNERLLPLFGIEGDAVLAFDNPVPTDREFNLRESQALTAGGLRTLNEDRKLRGDDPMPGGDVLRVNGQSLEKLDADAPGFQIPGLAIATNKPVDQSSSNQIAQAIASWSDKITNAMHGKQYTNDGWQNFNKHDNISESSQLELEAIDGSNNPSAKTEHKLSANGIQPERRGFDAYTKEDNSPSELPDRKEREESGREGSDISNQNEMPVNVERLPDESICECVSRGAEKLIRKGMDEDEAIAAATCMCGGKIVSHISLMQGLDTHISSKADAEDDVREGEPDSPHIQLGKELSKILNAQQQAVLAILGSSDLSSSGRKLATTVSVTQSDIDAIQNALENVATIEEIAQKMNPAILEIFHVGGREGIRKLGLELDDFDVSNPEVLEFLKDYSIKLARVIRKTTMEVVKKRIEDGLKEGLSTRDIATRMMDTGVFGGARAESIARSETARAYVRGTEMGWKQTGIVKGKQWRLAPNACQFCIAASKKFADRVTSLGSPFFKEGTQIQGTDGGVMKFDYSDVYGAPLHPNCRCDIRAVIKDS